MQLLIDALPPSIGLALIVFLWAIFRGTLGSLLAVGIVSTLVACNMLYLSWFFRDGMGPDAVTSFGLEALTRIGPVLLVVGAAWLMANGLAYARFREKQSHAA
jgi:hypothetical protein